MKSKQKRIENSWIVSWNWIEIENMNEKPECDFFTPKRRRRRRRKRSISVENVWNNSNNEQGSKDNVEHNQKRSNSLAFEKRAECWRSHQVCITTIVQKLSNDSIAAEKHRSDHVEREEESMSPWLSETNLIPLPQLELEKTEHKAKK